MGDRAGGLVTFFCWTDLFNSEFDSFLVSGGQELGNAQLACLYLEFLMQVQSRGS